MLHWLLGNTRDSQVAWKFQCLREYLSFSGTESHTVPQKLWTVTWKCISRQLDQVNSRIPCGSPLFYFLITMQTSQSSSRHGAATESQVSNVFQYNQPQNFVRLSYEPQFRSLIRDRKIMNKGEFQLPNLFLTVCKTYERLLNRSLTSSCMHLLR